MTARSNFRPDIAALRALAVVAVVLFHFKLPGFGGGFLGVDVFFVVSGFLMTGILQRDLERGRFSYLRFMRARALRIVPALSAMVAVLLLLGVLCLPPAQLKDLGEQARSALLFFSNIHYAGQDSYFAEGNDNRWLLHTWSLSVEWQFYMLYPWLLWLLHRASRRSIRGVQLGLWLVCAASLTLSCIQTEVNGEAAFLLLPSRAWEMAAGGIAYYMSRDEARWRLPFSKAHVQFAALPTLALILLAAAKWGWDDKWPGYLAVVPVVWTCAFLVGGSNTGRDSRWIGNPVTQAIGRWSYSIYLWHWPIAVAIKAYPWLFNKSYSTVFVGIALAFLLAALSFALIESGTSQTARHGFSVGKIRTLAGVFAAALITAWAGSEADGWPNRADSPQRQASYHEALVEPGLPDSCKNYRRQAAAMQTCVLNRGSPGGPRVLVYGDSHAQHLYPWFEAHSKVRVDFYTSPGCPPIPGLNRTRSGYHCEDIAAAATRMGLSPEYSTIVVSGRFPIAKSARGHCKVTPRPGGGVRRASRTGGSRLRLVGDARAMESVAGCRQDPSRD